MDRMGKLHRQIGNGLLYFEQTESLIAVLQAADDLDRKIKGIFKKGNLDAWAAALIYTIIRHHKLDDNSVNAVTLEAIAAFYDLAQEEVLSMSDKIKQDLELEEKFGNYAVFDLPLSEYHFEMMETDEDDHPDIWMDVNVEFRYRSKIGRVTSLQLEELIRKVILEVNGDRQEEDYLALTGFKTRERQIKIQLAGFEKDIDSFCDLMEEKGMVYIEAVIQDSTKNLFTPDDHYAMFMEQYESMNLDDLEFNNDQELQVKLDQLASKSLEQIQSENPLSDKALAIIEALKAFKMPKTASVAKVQKILKRQPACTEAHICLAGWEEDQTIRINQLERALDIAEESLDLDEIDKDERWWADHRTRPYMRAMNLLAHELHDAGDEEGCREILWELIEMNKNDNQGNRLVLMELCVVKKKWIEVRKLFANYPEDENIIFVYAKAIYLYYTLGNKSKTKKALIKAYQRNKYPLRLMAGIEELPESQMYYRLGDKTEAKEVIPLLSICFDQDKKLMKWVFNVLMDSGHWEFESEGMEIAESIDQDNAKKIPFIR